MGIERNFLGWLRQQRRAEGGWEECRAAVQAGASGSTEQHHCKACPSDRLASQLGRRALLMRRMHIFVSSLSARFLAQFY